MKQGLEISGIAVGEIVNHTAEFFYQDVNLSTGLVQCQIRDE